MRLFILLFFLCTGAWASGPVTFMVGPTLTPGNVCSSIFQAQETITASPTPGTVALASGYADSENVTLGPAVNNIDTFVGVKAGIPPNYNGTIASSGMTRINAAGGNLNVFNVNASLNFPITFININMTSTSGSSALLQTAASTSCTLVLSGCYFYYQPSNTGTGNCYIDNSVFSTASSVSFYDCVFNDATTTANGNGIELNALVTLAHTFHVTNSFFVCPAGRGYFDNSPTSSNDIIDFDHDTFTKCVTAFSGKSGEAVTNCIFINNTVDLSLTSPAVLSNFNYSQFGQLTSGATNSIYGATLANTFCDQNNFYPGPQDAGLNAGVSTSLYHTPSFNGVWRGSGGLQTIGACAYTPALCPGLKCGR